MEHPVETRDPRLAWLTPLVWGVMAITAAGVGSMLVLGRPIEVLWARWVLHNAPVVPVVLWAGRVILRRQPTNACGWLLIASGVMTGLHVGIIALADARLVVAGHAAAELLLVPAELPLDASIPLWISAWLWIPGGVLLLLLVLLIPDGRLPSSRWRWVPVTAAVGTVLFMVPYVVEGWPGSRLEIDGSNAMGQLPSTALALRVGGALLAVTAAACIVSVVMRWRTSDPVVRRQVRLIGIAGVLTLAVMVGTFPWQRIWVPLGLFASWGFTLAYVVAITRYRLHDLDVVISRTVVGTLLAALVTGIYLVVVVGAGALIGRGSQGTWLPLVAVGVTAVLFDPARRRVRRLVDQLLYGRDGDPSQVLSALAARLREAMSAEELLDRAVLLLASSTGADRAEVAVDVRDDDRIAAGHDRRAGGHDRIAAGHDRRAGRPAAAPEAGPELAAPEADPASELAAHPVAALSAPVVHRGERLGEVRLFARSTSDLTPDAALLLQDVAGTLGVVLANVRLTAELEHQVAELRRSRERLAVAHDEARRDLERDLHDGAQARLVALRIHLGLAAAQARSGVAAAQARSGVAAAQARSGASAPLPTLLASLEEEVDAILRSLRQLARGLHPPVLESSGIAAALRAEVRGLPLRVTVTDLGTGRYHPTLEAATYFACLELIQNVAKHAAADAAEIVLRDDGSVLHFTVHDEGRGFDPARSGDGTGLHHVIDRIAAQGGSVTVDSAPGHGCRIEGRVPVRPVRPLRPHPHPGPVRGHSGPVDAATAGDVTAVVQPLVAER